MDAGFQGPAGEASSVDVNSYQTADREELDPPSQQYHVFDDAEQEALKHKWIESERAHCDLGAAAIVDWVNRHWDTYLRQCWYEHVSGKRFWVEIDRGDFGIVRLLFKDDELLLDRIIDRLNSGRENLCILQWALAWGLPIERVVRILEALDINSRRLTFRF